MECNSPHGFQGTLLSPQRKPARALFSCFFLCSPAATPEESDVELELQSVPCSENALLLVPTSLHLPVNPLSAPHSMSAPCVRKTSRLCTLPAHHLPEAKDNATIT